MAAYRSRFRFKDARPLARAARIGLIACVVMGLIALVSGLMHRILLAEIRDGLVIPESEGLTSRDLSALRETVIGTVLAITFIVTVVFVLMWVYRTNVNTHVLFSNWMQFTPGWAVGWNFIPIASLWMPFKVMKELWTKSASVGAVRARPPWYLLVWWLAWIASLIANRSTPKLSRAAGEIESQLRAQNVELASDVLFVLAGVLLVLIIRRIQARHDDRASELEQTGVLLSPAKENWR